MPIAVSEPFKGGIRSDRPWSTIASFKSLLGGERGPSENENEAIPVERAGSFKIGRPGCWRGVSPDLRCEEDRATFSLQAMQPLLGGRADTVNPGISLVPPFRGHPTRPFAKGSHPCDHAFHDPLSTRRSRDRPVSGNDCDGPRGLGRGFVAGPIVPKDNLILYLEYQGLDAHADAWKKTAAYKILNDTPTGVMLEEVVIQLGDKHSVKGKRAGSNSVPFIKHVARSGFLFAVVGNPQDPAKTSSILVFPKAFKDTSIRAIMVQ